MKNIVNLFLVIVVLAVFSCKKDKKEDDHHDDTIKTNAFIQIEHKVGDEAFALNKDYKTAANIIYQISRLDYYLTGIKLMDHARSGGDDYMEHVLVSVPETNYSLGKISQPHVHGFKMFIGVEEELNHADPNLYPENHPLALRAPSMHWGWAAGYRFMVLEGMFDSDGDSVVDKRIFFHIGSDELLRSFEGEVHADVKEGEDFVVKLAADYGKLFEGIDLLKDNTTATMDNKELAVKVADNATKIFTIKH